MGHRQKQNEKKKNEEDVLVGKGLVGRKGAGWEEAPKDGEDGKCNQNCVTHVCKSVEG